MLSTRVAAVLPSPTLAIDSAAKALRERGEDIVSLSAGEPDFPTPAHIVEAATRALAAGETRYGPAAGKPALRQALARSLQRSLGREVAWQDVIAGIGGKQVLFTAISCLVSEGDEVLLPAPYWVSFADMVAFAGATLRLVPTTLPGGFTPALDDLAAAIGPRTALVILNSPHNPTGAVYDRAWLEGLAGLLRRHPQVQVISDETYDRLLYDGRQHCSLLAVAPDLADRIVLVGSFSKSYAMTGWRLGYAYAPRRLVELMTRIAGASTSGPPSFIQTAAVAALEGDQAPVEAMRRTFEQRRALICELLGAIPHVSLARPAGAFYVFADISHYLHYAREGAPRTSEELARYLLEQHQLALVHGSAFGAEGFVRLSFAAADEQIRRGVERLAAGLQALLG